VSPAGLDGNSDPIRTPERDAVIAAVVAAIEALPAGRRLVAIDGIDGAGKSTFADEVSAELTRRGSRPLVRSTIDSFHRPRVERHRRGPGSPTGFYLDSHQLDTLTALLLDPFAAGDPFVAAAFDEPTDSPVERVVVDAPADAVLVFDGLFLQRPELADRWDLTVYLDGRQRVTDRRIARATRDRPTSDPLDGFVHDLQWCTLLRRYVDGQRRYHDACDPIARADLVVANDDLAAPTLTFGTHHERTSS